MTYCEMDGDLFSVGADAIAHGVNCKGVMGAGIAAEFAKRYPDMKREYQSLCRTAALVPGAYFAWVSPDGKRIYNLATQSYPGRCARLEWIEQAVTAMLSHAELLSLSVVAVPRIGCGIGGLNWSDVRQTLDRVSRDSPVELIAMTQAQAGQ